jgi:membrane protease YdiL (CAAX protease family)
MTPLLAQSPREEMLQAAVLAAFLAVSAAIWTWIYARWQRREPIVPLARRRPVPWQALDLLFIFLLGLLLPWMALGAVATWMGPEAAQRAADQKPELDHPAEQLLRRGTPSEKAIAVVMAVIVAPLAEEFFFRVLLQGWLEALWSRWRRKYPELRLAPASWPPIVLPALLFALMHLRSGKEPVAKEYLTVVFLVQMAADLLVLRLAIGLLRSAVGATAADLGWKPEKLRSDAKLGLLALAAVIGPLLTIQAALVALVKSTGINYALDPIPLFLLALVFGALYHRTHRIAPSLVLHMAFNATSIIFLFAGL